MRSNFHKSCFVAQKRVVENRSLVEKEIQENKTIILTHLKDQNLSVSYGISEKISRLLSLFPFSQPAVKSAVIETPDLLRHDPQKIYDFTTVLVECSDYDGISQEDALCFVGKCPEVFQLSREDFLLRISTLFSQTVAFDIPWNVLIREYPQTLLFDPEVIHRYMDFLANEFGHSNVRHLVGNNPGFMSVDLGDVQKIMSYLYDTMGVSPYRITRSPNLLCVSLDHLKLRYEFVLRCGYYRHPDPKAKSARPVEASPLPHLILEPSVERFVAKATPGLTMEEFFVFTALFEEENANITSYMDEGLAEDEEEETQFRENFKGKRKSPQDKGRNQGRKRQIAGK